MSGGIGIRSYGGEVERHHHDHAQIVLPWRGLMEIEVDGHAGRVARGQAVFIAAEASHAFSARGPNAFVVLDLGPGDKTAARLERTRPFFALDPRIEALLDYLTAAAGDLSSPPVLPHAWTTLLADSLALEPAGPRLPGRSVPDRDRAALERAETFMRAHLDRPIRMAEVARAAGLGATRMHGLFRDLRGRSPHAVLSRMRGEAACVLLVETDRSIAEVAVMTGHADQSALNRRLKALGRPTPATVRRRGRPMTDPPNIPTD